MKTTAHTCRGAAAALALAAMLVVSTASALAAHTRQADATTAYPWPVKPFHRPHPIRGSFGDPRTIFHGGPTQSTLYTGDGSFTFHTGVDVSAPDGSHVYPVEAGTVAYVKKDWLQVDSGSGRSFQYWHITASVAPGAHVDAQKTVIGHIMRGWAHVHLTELDGGTIVNPLQPGHLTPYTDTTVPSVGAIHFRKSVGGADLMPELLRGRLELLANVSDTPTMPIAGPWHGLPVTPALVTWTIVQAATGKAVVPPHTAYDVRNHLPAAGAFWTVYARGTHQNMSVFGKHYSYMQPGVYRLRLTPGGFETASLRDGVYDLVVTATDIHGNHSSTAQRFCVHNRPGVVGS